MITHHYDPPHIIKSEKTIFRKWWQFWKPKQWIEDYTHSYGTVIDCEGKTIREIQNEIEQQVRRSR